MAFILAIILIAAWLRLWQLNSIPFGVEYDEAYNIDQITLFLDKPLKPGSYRVVTGMYDLATNARLVVYDGRGQSLPDNMITLDKFEIP